MEEENDVPEITTDRDHRCGDGQSMLSKRRRLPAFELSSAIVRRQVLKSTGAQENTAFVKLPSWKSCLAN